MKTQIKEWPYKLLEEDILFTVYVSGNPVAKGRPRMSRYGHVYTPSETSKHEEMLAWKIKEVYKSNIADGVNKFGLRCIFHRATRQRIDCDNLIKCVADAISKTKIVWRDDNQCLEIVGKLFLKSSEPHTEFIVHRIMDETPKDYCTQCKKEYTKYNSSNRQFCSQKCFSDSTRTIKTCKDCKREFTIPKSRLKYSVGFCSRPCAMSFNGKKKTLEKGPHLWKCTLCNGPVSRKEYKTCHACRVRVRNKEFSSNYWSGIKPIERKL